MIEGSDKYSNKDGFTLIFLLKQVEFSYPDDSCCCVSLCHKQINICCPAQHFTVILHSATFLGSRAIIACSNVPKFLHCCKKKCLMMVYANETCSPAWYGIKVSRWHISVSLIQLASQYDKWQNRDFINCRKFPSWPRRTLGSYEWPLSGRTRSWVSWNLPDGALSFWAKPLRPRRDTHTHTHPSERVQMSHSSAQNECKQCVWCPSFQRRHSGQALRPQSYDVFCQATFARACTCVRACVRDWDISGSYKMSVSPCFRIPSRLHSLLRYPSFVFHVPYATSEVVSTNDLHKEKTKTWKNEVGWRNSEYKVSTSVLKGGWTRFRFKTHEVLILLRQHKNRILSSTFTFILCLSCNTKLSYSN